MSEVTQEAVAAPFGGVDYEKELTLRFQSSGPTPFDMKVVDKATGKFVRGVTRIEIGPLTMDNLMTARIDVELFDGLDVEAQLSAIRILDQREMLRQSGSLDQLEADKNDRLPVVEAALSRVMSKADWILPTSLREGKRWCESGTLRAFLLEEMESLATDAVLHDRGIRAGTSRV